MGLFDSFKNAFYHPIDVNIVGDITFDAAAATIPLKIEIINKEPTKEFLITEIVATMQKTEERGPGEPAGETRQVFLDKQTVSIAIGTTTEPLYIDYVVHNTLTSVASEVAQQVSPDNQVVQGLLQFAGKAEQLANMADSMHNYSYNLKIELLDANGVRGYDDRKVVINGPGQFGGNTTMYHS